MKALWQHDNGILEFKELNEPQVRCADDIKIKVQYATIGIQDLMKSHKWNFYSRQGIAGYEMCGEIVDLGSKAKEEGFYVGQKISGSPALFCGECSYCKSGNENHCLSIKPNTGTICQYIVWKSRQCVPLPDDMDFKTGCLLEPVATVSMALERMDINSESTLCIFGGDFNALVMIQLAKLKGIKTIAVVEPKKVNRDMAQKLGADVVVDPASDTFETELMKATDFVGFQNVTVTSTADPTYVNSAMNIAAKGATVLFTVYFDQIKDIAVNSVKFFSQGMNVTSSFLYSRKILFETRDVLSQLDSSCLIPTECGVKDVAKAFEDEQKFRYPRIGIRMDF